MKFVHASHCAKRHIIMQVPNDTLREMPIVHLNNDMAEDFRHAFLWHLERHETPLSDLVAATGVSRDVLNKLKARAESSTSVENGMLIASYYGKTINEFIACKEATETSRISALLQMLRPEEQRILESQIRGVLVGRETE